jgi:2-dehydro-3-deoxyphosphogluconate aldolase / (4S)-4-hydroxy-2-oxoglutarate aldolase
MTAMEKIAAQRVVPVIRCVNAEDAVLTARAANAGGMQVVELTLTTPDVHEALRELRGDRLTLGLGSLLSEGDVAPAVEAGAEFVVTFGPVPGFVAAAHEASVDAVQGALTPGEVLAAHQAGADAVKVFPAWVLSAAYFRDLGAVLPGVRLMPTGGIGAGDVGCWFEAGAWAVGIARRSGPSRASARRKSNVAAAPLSPPPPDNDFSFHVVGAAETL